MSKFTMAAMFVTIGILAGCTGKPAPEQNGGQAPAESVQYDPAKVGSISGTVRFNGAVPKPLAIDMSADPACKGQNASEEIVVKDGKLANVLVYVKNAPAITDAELPGEVTVRQQGCRYVPHVVALRAGGTVRFLNADETMHNIHPMPHENKEWNAAQMSRAEPLEKKFANPELMIPVKCNQHPWMKMYVNVMNGPLFAVTGPDGKFELKGLPPGTYTVEAVHESMGSQRQEVTIAPRQAEKLDFTYAAQKGAAAAK